MLRCSEFAVAIGFQSRDIVDPDLDLSKFQSMDKNASNSSCYIDRRSDALYETQGRATNMEERKQYIRQFEKRLPDAEAYYLMMLQRHRIIPHSAKVQGWKITLSYSLNQQLYTVWLAE